jgi:hypothetical protein
MRRTIPLLVLLALLAAGCRIESNLAAQINADGTGVISAEIGYDEEAAAFIDQFTGGEDPFADSPLAGFPNATRSEEDRGGMHYLISTAEVEDIAAAIDQAVAGDENGLVQEFNLTITADRVEIAGRGSLAGAMAGSEDLIPADQLAEALSANLRITLPGKILEHNATAKDGNTLTWALPITGGDIEINAVSDPTQSEGGGFPMWVIIVIAAVVVAGIGLIVVLGRKRGGAVLPPPPPPAPEMPSA